MVALEHSVYVMTGKKPGYFRFLGLGLYLMATVADTLSASTALNAGKKATGLERPVAEVNPFLGKNPKIASELSSHPGKLFSDFVGASASFYSLGIAVPLAVLKGMTVANNLRIARRFNRANQIAVSAPGQYTQKKP